MISNQKEGITVMRKNEKKMQAIILVCCFLIFGILLVFAQVSRPASRVVSGIYYERGRVISIIEENTEFIPPNLHPQQLLEVEIMSGEFRGNAFEVHNNLMSHRLRPFDVGDRVIVELSDYFIQVRSPDREIVLLASMAIFLFLLAAIGGKRGILSMVGLIFSLVSVVFILIPLTLAGFSTILISVVLSFLIVIQSITLLAGFSAKSLAAIIGCLSGVVLAALFAFITGHLSFISGYHTELAGSLMAHTFNEISLSGVFISGVIIASIGAVSDTSVTISSAMEEIKTANPNLTFKELLKSGLNVGRDTMGTMSNTLILAFVGSSFSMILFIATLGVTWIEFINNDAIGIEIIQGIAGSVGIILTVPVTTVVAAKLSSSTFFNRNLTQMDE